MGREVSVGMNSEPSERTCLALLLYLNDAMEEQGITNQPGELLRRYRAIALAGGCAACPRRDVCGAWRRMTAQLRLPLGIPKERE